MRRKNAVTLSLLIFTAFICLSCAQTRRTHENINSTLWVQTSAEFRVLSEQTYERAKEKLESAFVDPEWTAAIEQVGEVSDLPPAIIMDIDETILDNSPFAATLIKEQRSYNDALWASWVSRSQAQPLPGALEFATYARDKGVEVFFVTNRAHETEPATRDNLDRLGFPLNHVRDTVLTKNEKPYWGFDKTSRRQFVAQAFRILLIVGNEVNDFVSEANATPEDRIKIAGAYRSYWGEKWFLLPNPLYGSWEEALYGFDRGLSKADKLRKKYEWLKVAH
jgi:acid phosphatase